MSREYYHCCFPGPQTVVKRPQQWVKIRRLPGYRRRHLAWCSSCWGRCKRIPLPIARARWRRLLLERWLSVPGDIEKRCYGLYIITCTLLVIKLEYFFLDAILKRIAFFFGSFITLKQVNDYVMIPEYQGEINICNILRYVTWPFVWSYGRPNVPYSVFFPAPSLCEPVSGLTLTFVTKTDTNVL